MGIFDGLPAGRLTLTGLTEEQENAQAGILRAVAEALAPGGAADAGFLSAKAEGTEDTRTLAEWLAAFSAMPEFSSSERLDWDNVPTPFVIGHRGTGNVAAPENTFAAFDYAASLGVAIELDVMGAADGLLVVSHDDTLTAATAGAVATNIAHMNSDALRLVDVSPIYRSDLFGPQRLPTVEEVFLRYGGKNLLMPEVKGANDADAAPLARLIVRYGLTGSVVVQSFSAARLADVKAVDSRIRTVLVSSTLPDIPTCVAAGHWGVFVDHAAMTAPFVTAAHAAGLKVLVWTVNRVVHADAALAKGVDAIASDDPSLMARNALTVTPRGILNIATPPNGGLVGSGYRPLRNGPTTFGSPGISGGVVTYPSAASVVNADFTQFHLPGVRLSAALATTQSIEVALKYVMGPTPADTSRFVGVKFCWDKDTDTSLTSPGTTPSGYYFILRMTGSYELVRVTASAVTTLTSGGVGAWTAVAVGATVPLKVDLTAANITVTRTDTGQTVTFADATHARSGFVAVFGSGVLPGLGTAKVTY